MSTHSESLEATQTELAKSQAWWTWLFKDEIIYPLAVFFGSRFALMLIGFIAEIALPGKTGAAFYHIVPDNIWLDIWARWDSGFYLEIAEKGYSRSFGEVSNVAFFPLYPMLVNFMREAVGNTVLAGVLVSNLCFYPALIVLYRLSMLEYQDRATARRAVFYLASFPTAFFFGAVYTESLFLLLSILVFYFARRQQWAWVGVFGMLASSARIIGLLLFLPVLLEWFRAHQMRLRNVLTLQGWQALRRIGARDWLALSWLLVIPLGLLSHMLYLQLTFNDPITFWTVQPDFGRQGFNVFTSIVHDFEPLFRQNWLTGPVYWNVLLDVSTFFLVLLASIRIGIELGSSYGWYTALSVLIPASSGTGSMIRYVVVLFPMFMLLARFGRNSNLDGVIRLVFPIGLGLLFALFVKWIFVG